jgi:hypothetical protein
LIVELELQDVGHQFLYAVDGTGYYLNPKTLDEIAVPQRLLGGNLAKVIEGGFDVKIRMKGDMPIFVHSSNRLYRCTVAEILERRDCKGFSFVERPWLLFRVEARLYAPVPWRSVTRL